MMALQQKEMTNTSLSVLQCKAYKRAFQLFGDLLAEGHQGAASQAPSCLKWWEGWWVGVAVGGAA